MLNRRTGNGARSYHRTPTIFASFVTVALLSSCGQGTAPERRNQGAELVDTKAAASDGAWSMVGNWPFIPIHAAVLPDGRLMTYGSTPQPDQGGHLQYDIWDPAAGLGSDSHLTLPNSTAVDTFCSGGLLMPQSGRLVTASGDWRGRDGGLQYNRNKDVLAFDYRDNGVKKLAQSINRQRWYGTMTMMPSGEVLMQGGTCWQGSTSFCDGGEIIATTPEIYRPSTGWQMLNNARSTTYYGETGTRWWYPRSWVAPDGRVFGLSGGNQMYYLNTSGQGSLQPAGSVSGSYHGNSASAVMYRPGKILLVGGGSYSNDHVNPTGTADAKVIDINSGYPVVTPTQSLNGARQWLDATVMADGQVLVTGGSQANNQQTNVRRDVAIWNPNTGSWRYGASAANGRLYHSSTVLLPDGRVWTGGGGVPGPWDHKNAEVYSPPYLFNASNTLASRPVINSAPTTMNWDGGTFALTMSDASAISKISFIAVGSVTHSFDMNQRYMELGFSQNGNTLRVNKPANARIAPPGFYMVFAFSAQGVPSVARIVRMVDGSMLASPDLLGSGTNVLDDPDNGGGGDGNSGGSTGGNNGGSTSGRCNEMPDSGFENGMGSWSSSTTVDQVSDANSGSYAARFTNGWIGNGIFSAQAGQQYSVTARYKTSGSTGWVGLGMDFFNASGAKIGTKVGNLAPRNSYGDFAMSDVAPAGTTQIRVWIYAAAGRTLTLDDVTLGLANCAGAGAGGSGDGSTNNGGGGSVDGGNTGGGSGTGELACNAIRNPGFESGNENWYFNAPTDIVGNAYAGNAAAQFSDGWIGARTQSAQGQKRYRLTAHYMANGAGWSGFGLDFFNAAGVRIGDSVGDLATQSSYAPLSHDVVTPTGTAEIRLWIFSGAGRLATVDDVDLRLADCQ